MFFVLSSAYTLCRVDSTRGMSPERELLCSSSCLRRTPCVELTPPGVCLLRGSDCVLCPVFGVHLVWS